ncbi:MAG TPA: hypothetical protein VF529_15805 [Solirubrobacteraceae bacterium]|jgi:hypothetical protein
MNVIRRLGSLACASAALLAAAPAHAAELPLDGTLDLSDEGDARIAGESPGSRAGWVVANAGDFNGDGVSDILVGAPNHDAPNRTDAGAAYVVFGPREGLPETLGAGPRVVRLLGAEPGDRLGSTAAAAGDVNGDGLADVIVGAPVDVDGDGIGETIRGERKREPRPGTAYVVLGRRDGAALDGATDAPGVIRLTTKTPDDRVGSDVGSVPDMDGDGRPEVVVGAERADTVERTDAGAAFVVFAKTLAAGPAVDLDTLGDGGIVLDGPDGGRAGLGVGGVGDLNGDGRGEALVGAPTAATGGGARPGAAYVVFGRATGGRLDLDALGDAGYAIAGGVDDAYFGLEIEGVGDVTGDNVPDVGIGSPGADRNQRADSGSIHFVGGKANSETIRINGTAARPGFRVDGATAGDGLGTSITTVDDVNGDGLRELAFAAPYADPLSRTDAGAAYVLFGTAMPEDVDLSGLVDRGYRIAGATSSARLRTVAGLGDFDADKVGDLAAGSTDNASGTVDVVLGPKPPETPPPPPDPGIAEELAAGCKAVTNVEIIVDDSFSMRRQDPDELRRDALELLITKPRNVGKVVGAVEFGTTVNPLFPPQQILERGEGSNQPVLLGALRGFIDADNGGTNYNIAFASAAQDNPAAQARIFITDGGHLAGGYLDAHRGGPPTFVIGLGIRADEPFGQRLQRIADETGGRAFLDVAADDIVRVMNTIDSALNCDVDVDTDEDVLTEDDPIEEQEVPLIPDARTCDLNVSWGDDDDQIEPQEVAFVSGDEVLGRAKGKSLQRVIRRPGKLFKFGRIKVTGARRGDQFGLRLSGMPAEAIRLRYRVKKSDSARTPVTSQITQSRRRNVRQNVRPGVG